MISEYDAPNHMLIDNLQTDKGKARIDGIGSIQCPFSADASFLGVAAKQLRFQCFLDGTGYAEAGRTLVGQGEEEAAILYDIIMPPDQAQDVDVGLAPVEPHKSGRPVGR